MPVPDGGFPFSRDYGLTIKCSNTDCPYNNRNKECAVPSAVSILPNGKCKPYQSVQEKEKKR